MCRSIKTLFHFEPPATDEEIRAAFRALAIENHPDKHPGDAKAALRFKRINAAYQVLRDPEKKEQYDQLTAPVEDLAGTALAKPGVIPPPGYAGAASWGWRARNSSFTSARWARVTWSPRPSPS